MTDAQKRPANERLRRAMRARGLNAEDVSRRLGLNEKTVKRWLQGQVPHPRHREAVCKLLDHQEEQLWPQLTTLERRTGRAEAEVIAFYPQRGDVPVETWRHLTERATETIDILVYAGLFLADQNPRLVATLSHKGSQNCRVRLLFGDPEGEDVRRRGIEEGIGDDMSSRARLSLGYFSPLLETTGVEIRLHRTTLYNSIYRFDNGMLINMPVYGTPAARAPVVHLRR